MKQQGKGTQVQEAKLEAVGLEVRQGLVPGALYVFAMDGKTIARQLGVRRMTWHKGRLEGFQRRLDKKRVTEIALYLSKNPVLPNALVIALQQGSLAFEALPNQVPGQPRFGRITITAKLQKVDGQLEALREVDRIGYVIDGQHRLKAIEESTLKEGEFPVLVAAFHAVDARFQLEQFYALNQTVQIPAAHLALLRRELGYALPPKEATKKAVSNVAGILQEMDQSPFQPEKHIKSAAYPGPLSVTVLEGMIQRAVKVTNLKFYWKQAADEIPLKDLNHIAKCLYIYWKAISEAFPQYWGKKPKDQRLFCAMGLYTMIMFYDKAMEGVDVYSPQAVAQVKKRLEPIADVPWDQLLHVVPGTPKATFRPEHLFDAIHALWQANGQRPYALRIADPATKAELLHIELP